MESIINCPQCNTQINIEKVLKNQVSGEVNIKYKKHYEAKDLQYQTMEKSFQEKNAEMLVREKTLEEAEFAKKEQDARNLTLINKGIKEETAKKMVNLEKDLGLKYEPILEEAAEMKKTILSYQQKEIQDNQNLSTREAEQSRRDAKVRAEESEKLRTEFDKQLQADKDENTKKMELQRLEAEERMKQMENTLKTGVRQVAQNSMQIQGEAGEISVENFLNQTYPLDEIESIKPGAKGADYLQHVSDNGRSTCGTIYIEVKRHKDFKNEWIPKFKNDIREKNTDLGVLISEVMPKGVINPIVKDGVWICSLVNYEFVIEFLRHHLIELNRVQLVNENVFDKQSRVYSFVTSKEFARILDSFYDSYQAEIKSVDYEEKLMTTSWSKRRKNLSTLKKTTSTLIGAFQSYSGDSISEIKALEISEV